MSEYEISLEQKWDKSTGFDYGVTYRWKWEVYVKPSWVEVGAGWADTEEQARLYAKQAAKLHYKQQGANTLKEDYDPSADEY